MSTEFAPRASRVLAHELRDALIAHCHLSVETIAHVNELTRSMDLDFAAAALRLGVVTQPEIDAVQMQAVEAALKSAPGVVEAAIRKLATTRTLTHGTRDVVKAAPHLIMAHAPHHAHGERVRALRTELMLLSKPSRHANMFATLSAARGEGRSQLCAELAIAFAQLDRKVLLVDADLRHPHQHVLFGAHNLHGLSSVLTHGEEPFLHAVENLPQLTLLTAGPSVPNPLELLSDANFRHLINDWRQVYDYVVLDTPPVAAVADGLVIAALAQQVLIVNRAQHTLYSEARELLRRLASTQSRVVGAVLNHF